MKDRLETIFGRFSPSAKGRLDLTFDYETAAIRTFRDVASAIEANLVIDIGANIGVYSVYVSDVSSVESIEAFEPAPDAHKLLQENVELQDNAGIFRCHNVALSNTSGQVKFGIVGPTAGNNRIVEDDSSVSTISVRAEKLDNVLTASGKTVCIKIDVEGHEAEAVAGAGSFLINNKCYLQIECLRHKPFRAVRDLLATRGVRHLFSLHHDHIFVSESLLRKRDEIFEIIQRNIALDLADLTALRTEKRKLAGEARKLWEAAGYRRDPLLK